MFMPHPLNVMTDAAESCPKIQELMCRPTVVFHVERGLSWVELAQRKQKPLLTSLCSLSCFTVSISFYITFLPLLIWVRRPFKIGYRGISVKLILSGI